MKGMMDEVVGSAKRKAGELTDNPRLQVEGIAQQVKGKVENVWGKTKEAVSEAVEDAELHIDTHFDARLKTSPVDINEAKCTDVHRGDRNITSSAAK
jgi:uncharacterized protein YjbJ (UPF0337 family)